MAWLCACGTGAPSLSEPPPDTEQQAETQLGVAPLVERAEAALKEGDYDKAIAAYGEALERTPWNERLQRAWVGAHVARAGTARTKRGIAPLRQAERDLRQALVGLPGDAELQRALGVILLDRSALETDDVLAAKLRAEAETLVPDVAMRTPVLRAGLERRLDLAYELLERGQLDAGIDDLERLHASRPETTRGTRLLAQALVRKGTDLHERGDYTGAAERFARAFELYAELAPCDGARCDVAEQRTAYQNLVVAWISAERWSEAQDALSDAERAGLHFPDLAEALATLR